MRNCNQCTHLKHKLKFYDGFIWLSNTIRCTKKHLRYADGEREKTFEKRYMDRIYPDTYEDWRTVAQFCHEFDGEEEEC